MSTTRIAEAEASFGAPNTRERVSFIPAVRKRTSTAGGVCSSGGRFPVGMPPLSEASGGETKCHPGERMPIRGW
jgi:hypothetical protein